jgi:hypothetical protein
MGSTSSASAKDGERNRNMQRHVGAGVSIGKRTVTTISCIKILSICPNEAKNSCVLPLLISRHYVGQHEAPLRLQDLPRMLNAAIQTARSFTGQVGRNRLLSLSGRDRRHAQRRTANGGADQNNFFDYRCCASTRCRRSSRSCSRAIIPARVRRGGAGAGRSRRRPGARRRERAPPRCDAVPRRCFPSERVRGLTRQYLRWSRRI